MKLLVDRERIVDVVEELTPISGEHVGVNAALSLLDQILEDGRIEEEEAENANKIYNEFRAKVKPMEEKADPRCDGCVYQHPFAENMSIDELNGRISCRRNCNYHYLRDGRWVTGFEEGHGLVVCSMYHWSDAGLVRK